MIYKVASGFDIPLISLLDMDPQPRSEGVKPTKRTFAPSGAVYNQGLYIELEWNVITEGESDYQSLLAQFGLGSVLWNEVTVYIPSDILVATRYNGIAVRPEPGKDMSRSNFFVRNVTIIVKDLEVAA